MAEYVNLVRRALGQIGGHGGVRGFFLQLFRVNDVKTGTLIGVDKYGNKYYEDKKHYFFDGCFQVDFARHQYVPYPTTRQKIHEWVPPKAGTQ
uniref:NADH dehydrogenase [ubiquinone] 1 alpha subcomplex subunit 12 n=1 Tax=Lates calcarifer TaxID=8187 RepID=A0A4W6G2A7_LATCA